MWKYFSTVLKHPYHLASAALGVGLSAIFASDILFLMWLMADSSAVFFLSTNPRIQRLIDAYAGRDEQEARAQGQALMVEHSTEAILAALSSQLPPEYRPQFDRMRAAYAEILKYIASRSRSGSTPVNITLARIHELLLMFFRLACYRANLLRLEQPASVERKIAAKRKALEAERDSRVRSALEATIETLEQQLSLAQEKLSEARATAVRLENMEEQMRIITSMTLTSDDVDAFDLKVNEIWSQLKTELDMHEAVSSFTTLQDLSSDPVGDRLVGTLGGPPEAEDGGRAWPPPDRGRRQRQ